MKRRWKLIWGASRIIKGRWYFGVLGFYDRVEGEPDSGVAVSLRGLLLWLVALGLVGYLAAATALVLWLDRNPYNRVTFADAVALPVRWPQFQALRGQSLLAEGRADMKAGHWADGLFKLRAGLAREPQDLAARLVLAQFYVASNQRPQARRTLAEGLGAVFPGQEYLEMMFALAAQAEDYALIDAVCERYLGKLDAVNQARPRRWLTRRQLQNFLDLGQPARVLAALEADATVPAPTRAELRVLALLALGRTDDARSFLAMWRRDTPAEAGVVLRLAVRVEREAGKFEAMERAAAELVALSPEQPAPYIYRTVQFTLAGRTEAAQVALGDFLRRFSARADNLRILAEPLATIKATSALGRIVAAAREQGFETRGLELLRAQALLEDGEVREASRILGEIAAAGPGLAQRPGQLGTPLGASPRQQALEQSTREWMQAIADAVLSPIPAVQSALVEAVRKRSMAVAGYRSLVTILRAGDRIATAQTVLGMARVIYPGNVWIETQLAELERLNRPGEAAQLARPAGMAPLDERSFFNQLNAMVAAADWAGAQQLVRDLRTLRPAPEWLRRRDPELLLAQIRIEQNAGDRLAMLIAAKLYLDGDVKRAQEALKLAQEQHAAGAKEEALLLVREVLRKTPDFPPALRLVAAWAPQKK